MVVDGVSDEQDPGPAARLAARLALYALPQTVSSGHEGEKAQPTVLNTERPDAANRTGILAILNSRKQQYNHSPRKS